MKQKMKRVLLTLCMIACLFSLSACSNKTEMAEDALDPGLVDSITQISETLLQQIASFSREDATELEAQLRKEKQAVLADALVTWMGVMDDTGALESITSSAAQELDGEYIGVVQAEFQNRNVEFKVFYHLGDQGLEPTSMSISPEYSTMENMKRAALNTLLGMGTVFLVLIFISILIGGFKYINSFEEKMKNAKEQVAIPAPVENPVVQPAVVENLADDLELVVVITAAIAASQGTPADGLIVRSIRRAPASKWKRA